MALIEKEDNRGAMNDEEERGLQSNRKILWPAHIFFEGRTAGQVFFIRLSILDSSRF